MIFFEQEVASKNKK